MKRFLNHLKRFFYSVIFGVPLTIWLLLRDRKTVYFIPHIGLGDYCIALGYLEVFKRSNHIEHITLVVPPNRVEVAGFYPGWDSLLTLKQPYYLGVVCFGGIPIGRTIHRRARRIKNISYGIQLNKNLYYNNPLASVDDVVKDILKLSADEMRKGPVVPEVDVENIMGKHDLQPGKTVLLNPYTSGMAVEEISDGFYIELADKLKGIGLSVATILGSENQRPVPGTLGIVAPLTESWNLAIRCGYVIGTRSGFFDFIQFSGCNIVGIYSASYRLRHFFSLMLPEADNHVREYILELGHEKELADPLLTQPME